MGNYKVIFFPDRKEVEVNEGTSLIEAAGKVGVYINSLCGGEGVCGKCRVQIIRGNAKVDSNSVAFFTKEEIEKGFVLACQTRVRENLEVLIPPESRLEEEQILSESLENKQKTWRERPPIYYSEPEWVSLHRRPNDPASLFEPLTNKIYLDLPKPTIDDNIPDTGRITRELRKKLKYPSYEVTLACLRDLFIKIRRSD